MLGSTPVPFAEPRRFGSAHGDRDRTRLKARLDLILPPPLPEEPPAAAALEAAREAVEQAMQVRFPGDLGSRIAALQFLPLGEDGLSDTDETPTETDAAQYGAMRALAPNARMRALADEFHRRQQQASWLVGLGLGGALVLTIAIFAAIVLYAVPTTAEVPAHAKATALRIDAKQTVAPGKEAPLLIRTGIQPETQPLRRTLPASPASDVIPARAGSVLALGAAIDAGEARYVLLRGVPPEMTLSAGQATSAGSWILSSDEVAALSAELGELAHGDHALEVYPLGADGTAPLRQRLVLRVETAAASPAEPASRALFARGERLRAAGDIAAARLIYEYLAERGDAKAAFALGATYDAEMLARWGAAGIRPDRSRAVAWYGRAARTGNPEAGERLKVLASLAE